MDQELIIKRLGRLLGYLERLDDEIIKYDGQDSRYGLHVRDCIERTLVVIRTENKFVELRIKKDDKR